jgi:uncharacterized membrane protein YciS (DUF1049 family)
MLTIFVLFIMSFVVFWIITIMPIFIVMANSIGRLESRIKELEKDRLIIQGIAKALPAPVIKEFLDYERT